MIININRTKQHMTNSGTVTLRADNIMAKKLQKDK